MRGSVFSALTTAIIGVVVNSFGHAANSPADTERPTAALPQSHLVDWSVVEKNETVIEFGASPFSPAPVPPIPSPAKIISPGTKLTFRLSGGFGSVDNVVWYRDEEVFRRDVSEILLGDAYSSLSGRYHATFSSSSGRSRTLPVTIVVKEADRHRLANQSSRVKISSGSPSAVFGFVIGAPEGSATRQQEILIRAVGPTLSRYDVINPLPDPEIQLHMIATGELITIELGDFTFPDGSTPKSRYFKRAERIGSAIGAFPISVSENADSSAPSPSDQLMLVKLDAGPYTVTVKSASGGSGEVLIEIYEIPHELSDST